MARSTSPRSGDQLERFEAAGWNTTRIDGHDFEAIEAAISAAKGSDRPTLIACRTVIGFGAPNKQGTSGAHGAPLGPDEIAAARAELGWEHEPFEIPADVRDAWRIAGLRSSQARLAWEGRVAELESEKRAEFDRRRRGDLPSAFGSAMNAYREALAKDQPALATRNASQNALDVVNAALPETIGGSADLTGIEQYPHQGSRCGDAGRFFRPFHSLWRARAWHGGGDERHCAAWRADPLQRDVSRIRRLLPARPFALPR